MTNEKTILNRLISRSTKPRGRLQMIERFQNKYVTSMNIINKKLKLDKSLLPIIVRDILNNKH